MFFDNYYPAEYTILEEFTVIDEIERATADIAEVNAGEHDDETGAALLSRADEVFLAALTTLSEAKAMLQFVLLGESEDIDVVAPLESVLEWRLALRLTLSFVGVAFARWSDDA